MPSSNGEGNSGKGNAMFGSTSRHTSFPKTVLAASVALMLAAASSQAQTVGGFGQRHSGGGGRGNAPQSSPPAPSPPQSSPTPPRQNQPVYSPPPVSTPAPVYTPPPASTPSQPVYSPSVPVYSPPVPARRSGPIFNPPTVNNGNNNAPTANPTPPVYRGAPGGVRYSYPNAPTNNGGGNRRNRPGRGGNDGENYGRNDGTPFNGFGQTYGNDNRPFHGFGENNGYGRMRVTTPTGPRYLDRRRDYYGGGNTVIVTNGPELLGGYYYGNYADAYYGGYTYPSVYSVYTGFPQYIYNPGVIVLGQPYVPVYVTPYLPFYTPSYPVTYNQNNYYVTSPQKQDDIEAGGARAKAAIAKAYPEGSFQAAFGDIERGWNDGSITLIKKHLRDTDSKIAVALKGKYSYSIASGDFEQITRDALDRLQTVSFKFSSVRKTKNGNVTAYGKHVYRTGDADSETITSSDTAPLDTQQPYDKSGDPAAGEQKTVYVSYTLAKRDGVWYIIATDSSPNSLVPDAASDAGN